MTSKLPLVSNPFLDRLSQWFVRNTVWFYPLYATTLFLIASVVLFYAEKQGDFVSLFSQSVLTLPMMVLLALLIILLGFPAPNFTHVSFDRVTQIGLIWIFGPAGSALVNGLASLTYPILSAQIKKQNLVQACIAGIHNAGVFSLSIYITGSLYQLLGGAVPLMTFTTLGLVQVSATYLCMQILNEAFLFVKTFVVSGRLRDRLDLTHHAIELVATIIALLLALIYNYTEAFVAFLFVVFLIAAIYCAKYLNKTAVALTQRIEQVTTLSTIAKAISSTFVLSDVTDQLYRECRRILDFKEFYFGIVNEEHHGMDYKVVQTRAMRSPKVSDDTNAPEVNLLIQHVLTEMQPVFVPSFSGYDGSLRHLLSDEIGAFIGVPIYFDQDVLGIIVMQSDVNNAFTLADFEFVQTLASHAGVAIKNASLFHKLEERKEELEQKVLHRTIQIESQKRALSELNSTLEAANQQKEELLVTLRQTAKELDHQCRQDSLTGLYNRRHLDEYLAREMQRIRRKGGTLSVALLDIDFFKRVNDDFSHAVGDMTLKTVANLIVGHVRTVDLVVRTGGEEILICLPDTNKYDAVIVCERVRESIQKFDWDVIATGLRVTASLGVAEYQPDISIEILIERSDAKMYQAKNGGRNQVCS